MKTINTLVATAAALLATTAAWADVTIGVTLSLTGPASGLGIPVGFVPHSTFWLVADEEVVGVSNLRHRLTDSLRIEGGHIGYGIRPSARGRGHGTRILALTLAEAARLGIAKALLTCAKANLASSAVIRANGGVLQDEAFIESRGEVVQRWWVPTGAAP